MTDVNKNGGVLGVVQAKLQLAILNASLRTFCFPTIYNVGNKLVKQLKEHFSKS